MTETSPARKSVATPTSSFMAAIFQRFRDLVLNFSKTLSWSQTSVPAFGFRPKLALKSSTWSLLSVCRPSRQVDDRSDEQARAECQPLVEVQPRQKPRDHAACEQRHNR